MSDSVPRSLRPEGSYTNKEVDILKKAGKDCTPAVDMVKEIFGATIVEPKKKVIRRRKKSQEIVE